MLTSWLIVAFLIILVFLGTRRWDLVPSGAQNAVEGIGEAFYDLVVPFADKGRSTVLGHLRRMWQPEGEREWRFTDL
jgi:F0F1-type ATP synthase membrane subunit a